MTFRTLLSRSLRFHARLHLGVVLGAATATAVLTGALVVGDSVRGSLRDQALSRLGRITAACDAHDRFFADRPGGPAGPTSDSASVPAPAPAGNLATLLRLPAIAASQDGKTRANRVQIHGVRAEFWRLAVHPPQGMPADDAVWINAPLARQLHVGPGDTVVFRIHKPGALSLDAVITPREDTSVALRLKVERILAPAELGGLSLQPGQSDALNAFVSAPLLAKAAGLVGRANLVVDAPNPTSDAEGINDAPDDQQRLLKNANLADYELNLKVQEPAVAQTGGETVPPFVELSTRRIFLEPASVQAAAGVPDGVPILTYLVNGLAAGGKLAPYSMVTAAGAPYTPADLKDDEIVVNEWLATDLGIRPGDTVTMTYYRADSGAQLTEGTNTFRVRSIVPIRGLYADRTLMPEFPGLAKAESTHDWDAGFKLVNKIREQDEQYWKDRRGTPKAFISLAAGQRLWANRFGNLTAERWPVTNAATGEQQRASIERILKSKLTPADFGLRFEPVRAQALVAAAGGTAKEFGGMFIGFSFFLIVSALLLTSLLFRFGLEQRAPEIGTLLAVGWPVSRVRSLFLREGLVLAMLGAVLGGIAGPAYGWAVLWGLNTIWSDAVAGASLGFHAFPESVAGGMVGGVIVAAVTLWLALRRLVKRPARELLNEGVTERAWRVGSRDARSGRGSAGESSPRSSAWECASIWTLRWLPLALGIAGLGLALGGIRLADADKPGIFFGAGALLLLAGLTGLRSRWREPKPGAHFTRVTLALRAPARQPGRSLATIALLASATFLLVAVAANRLDSGRGATQRDSGTGGFAYWAETSLPVLHDLNTTRGHEAFGLGANALPGVSFVPLRVRAGEEASCLNLNLPGQPRVLGVDPQQLARRGAFTFKQLADGITVTNGWLALRGAPDADEIPAIGDDASIQWALQKQVGGVVEFTDGRGRNFRLRLVGAVANSILQGSLLIDETAFTHRFPNESGYRAFLIDAPPDTATKSMETLTLALQDVGFEAVPATDRLARFNAVQNTYLNTFQVLGGLGLLLGSVGLGVVVLRNVYERRAELAVLQALGFEGSLVRRLVLTEHALLVLVGLGLGLGAAVVAVFPALSGAGLPWGGLALTLAAVAINGLGCALLATRHACRGGTLAVLQGE